MKANEQQNKNQIEINKQQPEKQNDEEQKTNLKATEKPIPKIEKDNQNEPKQLKFNIKNYDNSPLLEESRNDDQLLKDIFNELDIKKIKIKIYRWCKIKP